MAHGPEQDRLRVIDRRIGQNLRAIRRMNRLTQTELGRAVGVTFQQIQKYERGTNRLPASRLVQLAELLGVSPNDLLGCAAQTHWPAEVWDAIRIIQAIDSDHDRGLWLELGRSLAPRT
ncbi:MAG: helix-turn-helix transcriptional regulator [Planctomycetota bacterium]